MNIHEYQSKEILRQFGAPTPNGVVILDLNEINTSAVNVGDWDMDLQRLVGLDLSNTMLQNIVYYSIITIILKSNDTYDFMRTYVY